MTDHMPAGDLRERIAEAAAKWAYSYPISSNMLGRTDDGAWRLARVWGEQIARIAVLPVVEAETAALRAALDEQTAIARQTQEVLDIAHDTSNTSERERARAVQRAEEAEDCLRKAEQAYGQLAASADAAEASRARWQQRAGEAERQRDTAREAIADERRGRLTAEATARRMRQLIDSYPPDSRFARSGAQALFRAALDAEQPKETP